MNEKVEQPNERKINRDNSALFEVVLRLRKKIKQYKIYYTQVLFFLSVFVEIPFAVNTIL